MALKAGRARFALQMLPDSDFPDLNAGELPVTFTLAGRGAEAADRPHAIRHLHRGDALLSERHLLPRRGRGRARRGSARSRPTAIASPRPRCRRPTGSAGMPGIIVPRKTVGEIQKLLEDPATEVVGQPLRHQDPAHDRRPGADLEADRRHLPRLRAGDPEGQRQGADARQGGVRARRRPRLDHLRRSRAGGEAQPLRRQDGARREQSGFRQRHRRACRSATSPSRSRSASTRNICSTSPASSPARRRCSASPIRARRR